MKDSPSRLVFLSYSRGDEPWKDRLLPHLATLADTEIWHDRRIGPGMKWFAEINDAISRADVAICLLTRRYLSSDFCIGYELPQLLERRQNSGMLLVPILLEDCPWSEHPPLKNLQLFPTDGRSVGSADSVDQVLSELPAWLEPGRSREPPTAGTPAGPGHVDIGRLPSSEGELIGRSGELLVLDEAWESYDTNVVVIVGQGGVGKSTLVQAWLRRLEQSGFRGAERAYGWSFYNDAGGVRGASADEFLSTALEWFGDRVSLAMPAWEKGNRLGSLVGRQPCLVVLDGLEVLQSSRTYDRGQIRDPGLARFSARLALENRGLLVLTTRERVAGLGRSDRVHELPLDRLSIDSGASLLRSFGLAGDDASLMETSLACGNHALTLTLFGAWMTASSADARPLQWLPRDDVHAAEDHVTPVLEALERRLAEPELQALRIVGLFQRACDAEAVAALRRDPPLVNLTDRLVGLGDIEWGRLIERLRTLRLLAPESRHDPGGLDAHPLVREHFGRRLRAGDPDAFRLGNDRMYRHYFRAAPASSTGAEELAPLYDAMSFGMRAGHAQAVLDDIYWSRLLQRHEQFSWSRLGAIGMDLAALSGFFQEPWERLIDGIRPQDSGFVLGQAGLMLASLGRLREAVPPLGAGVHADLAQGNAANASVTAGNLAATHILLGELTPAIERARQSVQLADRANDLSERVISRTTLGRALHCAGEWLEARRQFQKAEELHLGAGATPFLYAGQGWQYCELLLEDGAWSEVVMRSRLNVDRLPRDLHAYSALALGVALLHQVRAEAYGDLAEAAQLIDDAVAELRTRQHIMELPPGLLARAELRRYRGLHDGAQEDLDEAMEIAALSGSPIVETDVHLARSRLFLDEGRRWHAADSLEQADRGVGETGYRRRERDIRRLRARLAGAR